MNRRILDCCCAILDDALTAESLAELEALLADDPQARRDYIRIMRLTALLERHDHKPAQSRGLRLSLSMPKPRIEKKFRVSSFGFRISTLALAAAILLALTAWFIFLPEPRTPNPAPPTPPASVATLTNTDNAVFADTPAPMNLGGSLPAGPIHLTSGTAQVMFASTAVVDLTGPCEFEMTGPNRGRLTAGTLEASVPEAAQGFTIDLPDRSRVVDLGTRFAVEVDQQGRSMVHVIEGRVQLVRGDRVLELTADQRAAVDSSGQIARITKLVHWNNEHTDDGPPAFDAVFTAEPWVAQPTMRIGPGLCLPPDAESLPSEIAGGEIVIISAEEGTVDQTRDLAGAIAEQQYIELSFTVSGLAPGERLQLDRFAYATRRNKAGHVRRGWDRSQVAVTVNDERFDASSGMGQVNRESEFRRVYNHEVDLDKLGKLYNGDTVRIRIYTWGSHAQGFGRPFHAGTRLGDIHLYGRVETAGPTGFQSSQNVDRARHARLNDEPSMTHTPIVPPIHVEGD